MAFCGKCGTQINEDEKFCSNCGSAVEKNEKANENNNEDKVENTEKTAFEETINKFADTKDTSSEYKKEEIEEGKGMAILSYISFLVLIPLFTSKSKYVRFHINQGLILFACWIIAYVIDLILPWRLYFISSLLYLFIGILSIIGIINVVNGKAKEIPILGGFKLIK